MKFLALTLALYAFPASATTTCGLYQIVDFSFRMYYTLTDFLTLKDQQLQFSITNPASEVVRKMTPGMCYCVTGQTRNDPEFGGDRNFSLIFVEQIAGEPFTECGQP